MPEGIYPHGGRANWLSASARDLAERNKSIKWDYSHGGMAQTEIARKYRLSRQRVHQILREQA